MIKIIEGNIVDAQTDYIIHQVNCQGEMNTGVAKALRDYDEGIYIHYMMENSILMLKLFEKD